MDAERQKLLDEIERLRSENAELNATVAELTRQVAKLTAALEEARRAGKRQAAPGVSREINTASTPEQPPRRPNKSRSAMMLLFLRLVSVVNARKLSLASQSCSIKWKSPRIRSIANLRFPPGTVSNAGKPFEAGMSCRLPMQLERRAYNLAQELMRRSLG